MNLLSLNKKQHFHFIGIGGSGMSSLANFLMEQGHKISGSDLQCNSTIEQFKKTNVTIYSNHSCKNIKLSSIVVFSNAILKSNIEIITAKKLNLLVIKRSKLLSIITKKYYSIIIAGSHGKTTTTGLIFNLYYNNNLHPSVINGGIIQKIQKSSQLGIGKILIVEADESDGSLVYFKPNLAVVTNIEFEHVGNYQNNFDNLKKNFIQFLHNINNNGIAIVCIDNVYIAQIIKKIKSKFITYGFNKKCNFQITNFCQIKFHSYFSLYKNKKNIFNVILNAPGKHNVLNATAAIISAMIQGIHSNIILHTLRNFQGIKRRFELLGVFKTQIKNNKFSKILLISDYGHHPNEIFFNIKTIRNGWKTKKLTMIFQPHRFTRTKSLFQEFIKTLSLVDNLILFDIYSAGEREITTFNSLNLCKHIITLNNTKPILIKNYKCILTTLQTLLSGEDILLIQGAGDIDQIIFKYLIPKLIVIK